MHCNNLDSKNKVIPTSRRKEIIKIRAEINEMEIKNQNTGSMKQNVGSLKG
jgi:hypothetical protein